MKNMKKNKCLIKFIGMIFIAIIFLNCEKVLAAKELTCIYEGGLQNSPSMIVQNSDGSIIVKTNTYGDGTKIDDPEWYTVNNDHEVTLDFDDTDAYNGSELTRCPNYIQFPAFSTYKYAFHDSKGTWRLDYGLREEYSGIPDEDNINQDFGNRDYSEEIQNTEWLAKCEYEEVDLYFNKEKYILDKKVDSFISISAGFSLNTLLNIYNQSGKCPQRIYRQVQPYGCSSYCSAEYSFKAGSTLNPSYEMKLESEDNRDPNRPSGEQTIEPIDDCEDLLGNPKTPETPAWYLVKVFNVLKYVAIMLLVVMSMLDFITATAAHDEDAIKSATSKVIKRIVLCVIIFILPYLIEFILKYISDRAIDLCGIG